MCKGPLLVNELNSIEPQENSYLTLHAGTTKKFVSTISSESAEVSNAVSYECLRQCSGYSAHRSPSRAMRGVAEYAFWAILDRDVLSSIF